MFMEPEKPKPGLSPPWGLRRGGGCLFSYLGDLAQHPAPLPKAAVWWGVGDWMASRPIVMSRGRDHKARGLAPPQRSHEHPQPQPDKERGSEGERPRAVGAGPSTWSPLHVPHAGPCTYLHFSPHLQMGSLAKLASGILPSTHRITAFSLLFAPFTPFLALWVEGKVGLRDRPEFGVIRSVFTHP